MKRTHGWSAVVLLALGCGDAQSDDTSTSSTMSASSTPGDTSGSSGEDTDPTSLDSSATDPSAPTASTDPTDATDTDGVDTTSDVTGDPSTDPSMGPDVDLPPPDGGLDYQLGGAYDPPEGVQIVSRDRNEAPAQGLYNICYVNGYQAQPDENDFWLEEHPDLVLRDGNGDPVIDPDWDEMLLDTSTEEKRLALAEIVGGWIEGCGAAGYQAVEIDNLDTYSRSVGLLTQDHNVAFMAFLSAAAHDVGMAIAQKNSTEILDRAGEMGTDFAVAEECNTYEECDDYIGTYGDAVLMIEYQQSDFDTGCAAYPGHSIVLRDLYLTTPGDGDYVYEAC
jgi:hypothetical protein